MTTTENASASPPPSASPPQPWGHWGTLFWTLLAVAVSTLASAGALILLLPISTEHLSNLAADAKAFSYLMIAGVIGETAVLAVAARLRHWRIAEYLGLVVPSRNQAAVAFVCVAGFVVALDLITHLLGRDVVTPFQLQLSRSAHDGGTWFLLLVTIIVVAPFGEEIMFRGFLYRGWARSPRQVLPAIVIISALWASLHSQYDWFGVAQIFLIGLLLGWVRWRSGSTLLTFALHGLINGWATIETLLAIQSLP